MELESLKSNNKFQDFLLNQRQTFSFRSANLPTCLSLNRLWRLRLRLSPGMRACKNWIQNRNLYIYSGNNAGIHNNIDTWESLSVLYSRIKCVCWVGLIEHGLRETYSNGFKWPDLQWAPFYASAWATNRSAFRFFYLQNLTTIKKNYTNYLIVQEIGKGWRLQPQG